MRAREERVSGGGNEKEGGIAALRARILRFIVAWSPLCDVCHCGRLAL